MWQVLRVTHPGCAAATTARISAYGTILRAAQALPSKGMYSMKRTLTLSCRVSATKSSSSSSFTPRMTTQFTLTGAKPSASAVRMEASTRSWPARRVSSSNLAGTSESRLMFTAVSPAARSAACRSRWRGGTQQAPAVSVAMRASAASGKRVPFLAARTWQLLAEHDAVGGDGQVAQAR
jgi:hypothetical protein